MTPGKIIILNGASSSGKSTIIKLLQTMFEEPYLDAGLDRFLYMLPDRYLDRPLWDDVLGLASNAGSTGHRLVLSMHRGIAALAESGCNVVADHVLVEQSWLYDCAELFVDCPTYFIGIRCPLEVLEGREKARRNRTLGQARLQYPLVHVPGIYDLDVDTSQLNPMECARFICQRVQSEAPPDAFKRLLAIRK